MVRKHGREPIDLGICREMIISSVHKVAISGHFSAVMPLGLRFFDFK
jgi:hypothetical protein